MPLPLRIDGTEEKVPVYLDYMYKKRQKCGCCALFLKHQRLAPVSDMADECLRAQAHTSALPVVASLHMSEKYQY